VRLPKLTEEIMGKLKDVEGGAMVGYSIDRGLPFDKRYWHHAARQLDAEERHRGRRQEWKADQVGSKIGTTTISFEGPRKPGLFSFHQPSQWCLKRTSNFLCRKQWV